MSECKTRGICDLVNVETDRKSNVANVKPAQSVSYFEKPDDRFFSIVTNANAFESTTVAGGNIS